MAEHYVINHMPVVGTTTNIPLAMGEESTRYVPMTLGVEEYRAYYHRKTKVMNVEWPQGQTPIWWEGALV
jgi:hypothetical protein